MKSSRNFSKKQRNRRFSNDRPLESNRIGSSFPVGNWKRLLALRPSFLKVEIAFWLVYLILPLSTGWLDYQHLPNEQYDAERHELLDFHTREGWPNGLGSYKVPDVWRDAKTGERFTTQFFYENHKSEARRLAIAYFAYGLLGCAFFALSRVVKKKRSFLHAFRAALMVNTAISILAFVFT